MKIAFDLDSVLNVFHIPWGEWIRRHDPDFSMENVVSWDTSEYTTMGKKVFDYLLIPGVFYSVAPAPGHRTVTNSLAAMGHELFVVSSALAVTWPDKVRWIQRYVPAVPERNLMSCSRKGLLDVDMLVDDGLHNFIGFEGHAVIMDHPWNRNEESVRICTASCSTVCRISCLDDLMNVVKEYA
jgi:5'(3')-deoxyribonucleotidase